MPAASRLTPFSHRDNRLLNVGEFVTDLIYGVGSDGILFQFSQRHACTRPDSEHQRAVK